MKKIVAKVLLCSLALTLFVSMLPTKQPKAEVNKSMIDLAVFEDSLSKPVSAPKPAPNIIERRTINTKYERMESPFVEAIPYDDGTGTGYLDVSWEPVANAQKYQILLFNGSKHHYFTVNGDITEWTTKGKKMFPTPKHIETGMIDYLRDGSGMELSIDPTSLYKKAFEVDGMYDYSKSPYYYVRVTAIFENGASPISYATISSLLTYDFDENGVIEQITPEEEAMFEDIPSIEEMSAEELQVFNESLDENITVMSPSEADIVKEAVIDLYSENGSNISAMSKRLGLSLSNKTVAVGINVALDMAVFGVAAGSVKAFIVKKGKKEAARVFTKTVKSRLIAWGAPALAVSAVYAINYAIVYFDIGARVAIYLDGIDYKPRNGRINF
ncbi:hypothetical protein ABEI56_04565 [Peribacillus castrilensis]|uniref:Uncharacterized protein n=2 Tax=Peribacillus TaxID=2675229 RepID=A0AAJ1QLU1_9BACI|nr:hypothetical protein [Peribacillus frigoritolerans]MDM5283867.1 hypothetical protein [Peribacillus frigoritolerans]